MRNYIISVLSEPAESEGNYEKLKQCLGCGDEVDSWFEGIIDSLYYRPNRKALVLLGEQGIGKSWFFRHLLPRELYHAYHEGTFMPHNILINHVEFSRKSLSISSKHDFQIIDGEAEKRLASYCSTATWWPFEHRHNIILVGVEKIDQELYNSINKLDLWKEIFNRWKR